QVVARQGVPVNLNLDWTTRPNSASAQIVVQQPQLELTLAGPKDVLFGEAITFLMTVANPGNGDAENVFVKLSTNSNAPETINIGTIAAGQQKQVEVQFNATQAGTMSIKAAAQAEGELKAEILEEVVVRRAKLDLAVSGPKLKFAGSETTYQIQITNSGNAIAEEVVANVLLPAGAKVTTATDGSKQAGSGLSWRVGSMGPGAERTLQFTCELTSAGDNRLEVRTQGAGGVTATEAIVTQVQALADLKLTVNEPKGPRSVDEPVQYEIQIVNRGTKSAEKVNILMQFSEGIEPIAAEGAKSDLLRGQVVFSPIGKIEVGQTATLKVRARADKAGSHLFRVEVKCDEPETRLVFEGTTRFFEGEGSSAASVGKKTESTGKAR
ncbi:MAG: Large cysteine-rich periplasmic protein OmcB, partial [Planctomycetota bacterium]